MDINEKSSSKRKPKLGMLLCTIISGTFLAVSGYCLGFMILPEFVNNQIWESTILRNGTNQWKVFEEVPFAFYFKVHMFNITNYQAVLEEGAKPVCNEIGPYVYKLYKKRVNIEWINDDLISYRNKERYEFDQIASGNLSENDELVILNPIWNGVLQTTEIESPEVLSTLSRALPFMFGPHNGLFMKISVKTFLFEGYSICNKANIKKGGFAAKIACSQLRARNCRGMELLDDEILFGYFYDKNSSVSGMLTINSGLSKKEEYGKLIFYQNDSHLHTWGDDNNFCNSIESVALFPPFVNKDEAVHFFTADICRTIIMDYLLEDTINSVKGYTFEMRVDTFDSLKHKAEHECFCDNKTKDIDGSFQCLADGLLDLNKCVGGPMIFSNPHLLYVDRKYTDLVVGLQPDRELHSSIIVLEPYTGTLLKLSKTGQFNMFIHSIEGIESLQNVTNAIVPLLWLEESMQLPEKYTDLLKSALIEGLQKIDILKWGLIAIGLGLITIGMGCVMCYY